MLNPMLTLLAASVPLLMTAGCAAASPGEPTDTGDPVLPLLDDLVVEAWVHPSAATALQLEWSLEESGVSWVEYQILGEEVLAAPALDDDASGRRTATLAGLPADADICFSAFTRTATATHRGFGCGRTGAWDKDIPAVVLMPGSRGDRLPGFVLVSMAGPQTGVVLVDRRGRVVWYWSEPTFDPMSAEVASAGGVWVVGSALPWTPTSGVLHRVDLDGSSVDLEAPGIHHALAELRDGSVAWVSADVRQVEEDGAMVAVAGDTIEIARPDGTREQLFNMWDWDEPGDTSEGASFYGDVRNWGHANSLDLHPTRDTLLLGFRDLPTLLEVRLDDGAVVAEYGKGGDVDLSDGSRGFTGMHDSRWSGPDTILLTSSPSETIALEYDVGDGVMTERWSFGTGLGVRADVHGAVYPLRDGSRLVGFGNTPWIQEVTSQGEVAWELRLEGNYTITSLAFVEDIYDFLGTSAAGG